MKSFKRKVSSLVIGSIIAPLTLGATILMVASGPSVGQDVGPTDPWCELTTPPTGFDKAFEPAIKIALQGEVDAFTVIGAMPEPIPKPARNQLDEIANLFNKIGIEVIKARTYAIEPDPQPDPDPQALNALEHARLFANLVGKKIEKAHEKGIIGDGSYSMLNTRREELIGAMPEPIP